MKRTSVASKSANLFGAGKDGFTDGVPSVTAATVLESTVMNSHQEEMAGVIEISGASVLVPANSHQLAQTLQHLRELAAIQNCTTVASGSQTWRSFAGNGAGRIVAVGFAGSIASSDDGGLTWTTRTAGSSFVGSFQFVTFSNGLFIATGAAQVQTSADGITWTQRVTGTSRTHGPTFWTGTAFVHVAGTDGSTWATYTSPNGVTWTVHTTTLHLYPYGSAFGGGVLIAGDDATSANMYTSTDGGLTWASHAFGSSASMQNNLRMGYASDAALFYAYGVENASTNRELQSSPDGLTWTRVRNGGGGSADLGALITTGVAAYGLAFTYDHLDWAGVFGQCVAAGDFKTQAKPDFTRADTVWLGGRSWLIMAGLSAVAGSMVRSSVFIR